MKTALACLLGIAIGAGAMLPVKMQRDELAAKVTTMAAEKEQMINVMAGKDAEGKYGRVPLPDLKAIVNKYSKK